MRTWYVYCFPQVPMQTLLLTTFNEGPYCPDDAFHFLDTVKDLRGTLQQCRISGFPLQYTECLLGTIFGHGDSKPDCIIPTDYPWPDLPPSPVCSSYGPSLMTAS